MCGTFKETTIKTLLKDPRRGYTLPVWSMNKPWKNLEKGVLNGLIRDSNIDLAALSLCNLENVLRIADNDPDIEFLLCERGVLDNMFYQEIKYENLSKDQIKQIRQAELDIESEHGFKEIRNTVLVMEDEDFIENCILLEPSRRKWFPDVESYLREQEKYVKFIFSYLNGEMVERRICSAAEYLKSIGVNYNLNH